MAVYSNFLLVVLLWMCCTIISGLFTVQAKKSHYMAEYGGNVSMECQFTMDLGTSIENLNVLWKHRRDNMNSVEVVKYINGKNIEISQSSSGSDRMKLLSNELRKGRAILHISKVKMTDAGQYLCIISSQGSDFKVMNLDVQAPYKEITKQVTYVVNSSGETVREVSCQSFGYPEAKVTWMIDNKNFTVVHNTSYTLTADRLFNVTSIVRIPAMSDRTLTCTFWNKITHNPTSLTFNVSENVKNEKSQAWKLSFVSLTILIVIVVFILVYVSGRYKKCHQLRTSICTDTLRINADMSSANKYSSSHFGSKSGDTVVDVKNTVTRLLNSS
ncbi:programmed cell death 1 ligand 2-like isoform X1 [Bufo bufo]|uniref:programmed cell death 1 ligand 2-like isoform X1 n=1 Tax=Bufo bufo TaxID=8384 RepID=UPI001ABE1F86|nr:programmed cell death 1 ligand 2-like isoform X1 [Bufo bufo]